MPKCGQVFISLNSAGPGHVVARTLNKQNIRLKMIAFIIFEAHLPDDVRIMCSWSLDTFARWRTKLDPVRLVTSPLAEPLLANHRLNKCQRFADYRPVHGLQPH